MIETILMCALFGVFILVAYSMGLKNGQKLVNKEEIKVPIVEKQEKPVEKYEEDEEFDKQQEAFMQLLENIENYDGTSRGQKKITMEVNK